MTDIVVALGGMGLFGIPLGVASVGGLLMLLGFSIDTDMLSAVRILKRNDATPEIRAFSTFKTGLTMTFTAIISFCGSVRGLVFCIHTDLFGDIGSRFDRSCDRPDDHLACKHADNTLVQEEKGRGRKMSSKAIEYLKDRRIIVLIVVVAALPSSTFIMGYTSV